MKYYLNFNLISEAKLIIRKHDQNQLIEIGHTKKIIIESELAMFQANQATESFINFQITTGNDKRASSPHRIPSTNQVIERASK